MTLDQIEAFLTVYEHGTFSRAASAMHLTDSALSHRVIELERELGFSLLNRGKGVRTVSLTPEGLSFLPLAQEWKRLWEGAVGISHAKTRVELSLAAVHSLSKLVLPRVLNRFSKRRLPASFFLKAKNSQDACTGILEGSDDIAILNTAVDTRTRAVTSEMLARERVVVVSGPDSPYGGRISVADLSGGDEVAMNWNPLTDLWRDRWLKEGQAASVRIESISILPDMLQGLGSRAWAFAPLSTASDLARTYALKVSELDHSAPAREIWIATSRSVDPTLRDALLEDLRDVLSTLNGIELVG